MIPPDKRLLERARKTVAELKLAALSSDQELLVALDTVYAELTLRNDRDFYIQHFRNARELADRGRELVRKFMADAGRRQGEPEADGLPDDESPAEQVEAIRETLRDLVLELAIPAIEKSSEIEAFLNRVDDWEYLMFGDPAEDISMLFFTLSGHVSKDAIMELYRQCGGREISEYRLRYFDVISHPNISCAQKIL